MPKYYYFWSVPKNSIVLSVVYQAADVIPLIFFAATKANTDDFSPFAVVKKWVVDSLFVLLNSIASTGSWNEALILVTAADTSSYW